MSSFLAVLLAFGGAIYIDGYGYTDSAAVAVCLEDVGANHEDELHDGKWEEFTDCLTWRSNH